MTYYFYFDNFLRDALKELKKRIRAFEKQWNKAERTLTDEVESLLIRAERSVRISIAKVKDAIRGHIREIPPLIDEAFTVDSPEKAAEMAKVYGEELALALYDTQLRIEGMQNAIIRAAAPLAQAVVPLVNGAVKALTVLANTVGKLMGAFVQSAFGIKLYEKSLQGALQTTGKLQRYLAGFDQIERLGSSSGGISGLLIPETEQVIPGWQALAEKIDVLLEPIRKIDLSPAIDAAKTALKALQPILDKVLQALEWGWYNLLVPLTQWAAETVLPAFLQEITEGLQTLGQIVEQSQPVLSWLWENFFQKLAQYYAQQILADIQAMGDNLVALGEHIREYMPSVQFLMDRLDALLTLGRDLRYDASLWDQIFKMLLPAMTVLGDGMNMLPGPMGVVLGLLGAFLSVLSSLSVGFEDVEKGALQTLMVIKNMLNGLWDFTEEEVIPPAEDGTKKFLNNVVGQFESAIRGISSAYNGMVSGMADNAQNMGQASPDIKEAARAFRLKKLSMLSIPRLAQGAVLPANQPFMAVVGDQTHGTNVEAPLTTIQQALDLALADRLEGMMAGFNAVTSRQEQILDAILGLDVSDASLAGAVKRYERRMALATGGV